MSEQSGLIPIGQAARLLMISEERIRQLIKQGYVPKSEKRGYVQLVGAVQGYLKYLKEDERRSTRSAADSRVRDARALEIELRIAERTRDLIPLEDALTDMAELAGLVRSELAGLPARLSRIIDERQKVETEIDGVLTDKVNAIINCHLATGRIGRPGMGPFSVTGQPNAMGGREVGGLANMLAAHMDFTPEAIERVGRFWQSPGMTQGPGLKAVDLFASMARGEIKAVWIMATNPVVSMPEADAVRDALAACPFVVVSDMNRETDTMEMAHVRLPALGWGEKDGTVTNSERRISRQRPFLTAPGEAKADWWIISEVARRMGHGAAFDYAGPAEIFAEHVALSAFENHGGRDFDLSGLEGADYETLSPVQWPVRAKGTPRMFGEGGYFTPDGKARFVAIEPPPRLATAPGTFTLNSGRVRDHWHTMTRTGKSARLSAHMAEPFVEIHPDDARTLGIHRASLVALSNRHGSALVRALITERQQRGQVFVPMHWTRQFASSGRIDTLVPGRTDPVSGQPALKMARVHVEPALIGLYGFLVTADKPAPTTDYWAMAPAEGGWRTELGAFTAPGDLAAFARSVLGGDGRDLRSVRDERTGRVGFVRISDGRLIGALYLSPEPVLVSRQWAVGLLAETDLTASTVLAGRPRGDRPDGGAIVCACNSVGINTITDAIDRHGCRTVEAISARTRAGTNCGSCRAELRTILEAQRAPA